VYSFTSAGRTIAFIGGYDSTRGGGRTGRPAGAAARSGRGVLPAIGWRKAESGYPADTVSPPATGASVPASTAAARLSIRHRPDEETAFRRRFGVRRSPAMQAAPDGTRCSARWCRNQPPPSLRVCPPQPYPRESGNPNIHVVSCMIRMDPGVCRNDAVERLARFEMACDRSIKSRPSRVDTSQHALCVRVRARDGTARTGEETCHTSRFRDADKILA